MHNCSVKDLEVGGTAILLVQRTAGTEQVWRDTDGRQRSKCMQPYWTVYE